MVKARITPQNHKVTGQVNPQNEITVSSFAISSENLRLGDLFDVDTSGATDGAVLVYDGTTAKFQSTTEIKNPNTQVNGGHY